MVNCEYWSELRSVGFRPPVVKIAFVIELTALIVEAVRQFVAYGRAGVAEVGGFIHLRIEQRRLQHAGREINVVHLRVVISIDSGRRHHPLGAIYGLPDFVELAVRFEDDGALKAAIEIVAGNGDGTVVAPLIGVADFIGDGLQLEQRLFFRRGGHPGKPLDLGLHGGLDVFGHGESARFRFRSECFVDENVTQGFAERVVDQLFAALPARLHGGDTAQIIVEEVEVGLHKWRREEARLRVD